jgi:hypothetical protein
LAVLNIFLNTHSLYLPPYSPHLNIAETLWRILKGKWIRPPDYVSTDTLFYSTNRALAAVGKELFINYLKFAEKRSEVKFTTFVVRKIRFNRPAEVNHVNNQTSKSIGGIRLLSVTMKDTE